MKDVTGKKDRKTAVQGTAVLRARRGRCGLAAVLFALFAFCFVMNLLSPAAADDFSYALSYVDGSRVTSLGEAVRSMAAHYRIHGGRVVVHFFATVFMMLPKPVFDACNALMTVLLIVLVAAHIRPGEPIRAGVPAVLFSVCWFFLPVWGHTVFFLTGACNYLWPMVVGVGRRPGGNGCRLPGRASCGGAERDGIRGVPSVRRSPDWYGARPAREGPGSHVVRIFGMPCRICFFDRRAGELRAP